MTRRLWAEAFLPFISATVDYYGITSRMSNEESNFLPPCQLSFLWDLVGKLYSEKHPDKSVWWPIQPLHSKVKGATFT
jgi:hypothetical protein